MKLTMTTSLLQTMVARAMKGASNNKMIPLTNLMAIELKDHKLTLTTSDATNYLYIMEDNVDGDDFYVVVPNDIFSKLIARLTCDKVSLELNSGNLIVEGNGKYKIELPLDEEGELIKYPNPVKNVSFSDSIKSEVNLSTIRLILNTAKVSLATTDDIPCYTGYYIGDKVIATDTSQICGINIKLFDTPVLISANTMDLLDVMSSEKIEVFRDADSIVFRTADCTVYGVLMEDCIADYQVDAINEFLETKLESSCKLSKSVLLQLLDRLSLFVGMYDKNEVCLTFTVDGLVVTSKQANSSELIKYMDSKNFKDFVCKIDIEMFRTQVKANTGDVISMEYGISNAIKITDGNVTQILALADE